MSEGDHIEHGRRLRRKSNLAAHLTPIDDRGLKFRGLVALLFGLVAFMTLGALVPLYMANVGGDVLLAVIAALTPGAAP